ncbi:MAG: 5-formyltetrahydrofolate cyclo-ligase [Cytophagales bacterium]|nr:5-formyltetrahydrofolate cyclo-ligase [Cytophagales bacterium]
MSSKSQLRTQALVDRKALSSAVFEKKNKSLVQQLQAFVLKEDFKIIHTFLPIAKNHEPDMTSLFKGWWKEGRRIMVSKIDLKTKQMTHYWFRQETKLETNSWDIPEPANAKSADFNEVDLVIVPLLLGDMQGNRIGYGGGYYDQLLGGFNGQTVGLSLLPLMDQIETEEWDVPLDVILFPE